MGSAGYIQTFVYRGVLFGCGYDSSTPSFIAELLNKREISMGAKLRFVVTVLVFSLPVWSALRYIFISHTRETCRKYKKKNGPRKKQKEKSPRLHAKTQSGMVGNTARPIPRKHRPRQFFPKDTCRDLRVEEPCCDLTFEVSQLSTQHFSRCVRAQASSVPFCPGEPDQSLLFQSSLNDRTCPVYTRRGVNVHDDMPPRFHFVSTW